MTNYCDGNHQCIAYPLMCGASDGAACGEEFLCDGVGDCVFVDVCDGGYASTGYYVCGPEQVEEECYLSCTTESQCNSGYYCVGKACIFGLPNGQGPCTEHGDCASGYCSVDTGLCCGGSGDDRCCASAVDCNDNEKCTFDYCDDDKVCRHDDLPDYSSCPNDIFCDGYEVCFGGVCAALEPDPCEGLNSPCREVWCEEEDNACRWKPIKEGEACSDEPLFCTGEFMKCEDGLCMSKDPEIACEASADPCTIAFCNETERKCEYQAAPEGTACGDDDPCNGLEVCAGGGCAILPGSIPCEDGDYCTTQTCIWDEWSGVVCGDPVPVSEGAPCAGAEVACLGAATCQSEVCIPAQDRPCNHGNICIQEACTVVSGAPVCTPDLTGTVNELECGEVVEVGSFSRQYYSDSYQGSACAGQTVSGLETGMALTLDTPATVTLQVEEMDPEVATTLLAVTDLCNPSGVSCYKVQDGLGVLTLVDLPAGTYNFLLETDQDLGPGVVYSAQVRVTCN
jgi:hypothetical protein